MPIVWRCACGKKLKAADTAAGKRVACTRCSAPQVVPGPSAPVPKPPPLPPPLPAAVPADAEDDYDPPPRPAPRRRHRPPAGSGGLPIGLLVGLGAVLLVGCLGAGGAAVYYFGFRGGS